MISKVIQEEKIIATLKAINKAERIAIVTHKSPDGDAVGSSLGLYHFLQEQEKAVALITPDRMPDYLRFLPGSDEVVAFSDNREAATEIIREADLLFCLDFNIPSRTGAMAPLVEDSTARKVMIDHHLEPGDFTSICISHPEISSTCSAPASFLK